jgi:hypothetical protein
MPRYAITRSVRPGHVGSGLRCTNFARRVTLLGVPAIGNRKTSARVDRGQ